MEMIKSNLTASTWRELETKGKFDKNEKLSFISDDMLILGMRCRQRNTLSEGRLIPEAENSVSLHLRSAMIQRDFRVQRNGQ